MSCQIMLWKIFITLRILSKDSSLMTFTLDWYLRKLKSNHSIVKNFISITNLIRSRDTNMLWDLMDFLIQKFFKKSGTNKRKLGMHSQRHSGPENFKKSIPKKLVKSNKSISRKNFLTNFKFFAITEMAINQFLNWEKV